MKNKINFKRAIASFTTFAMISMSLVGCGSSSNTNSSSSSSSNEQAQETKDIVCTIFPIYDWLSEIIGDNSNIELHYLMNNGVDLHSFQPSVNDIIAIQESDLFVYVGGESDTWVDSVLSTDVKTLNLIDVLGDKVVAEEIVEGMQQTSHDHDHDEDDHDHDDHAHDEDDHVHSHSDEHVWLSLNNAKILVNSLLDEVVKLSPENTDSFTTRAEDYINDLDVLDDKYSSIISGSNRDVLLVADRFPLRYLVDDYDLDYYAAFSGCSAEAEVSFETIKFLTDKVDELGLTSILIMEDSTQDMAQTIINNSTSGNNIEILTFNSMQSITNSDIKDGVSYIEIMRENLEDILAFALD